MVFSSELFIYLFMPVFFALYYLIADRFKNHLILVGSLIFYMVGAGSAVLVLVVSIVVNQFLAVRIQMAPEPRRKVLLTAGILINLLGLLYYKYTIFLWQVVGDIVIGLGLHPLPAAPAILLPIGISFFTFQAISYIVDVYTGAVSPAASYGEFAAYHSLFPQLVAGPIVRFREIKSEIENRSIDRVALTEGAYRFCLGLGKKMVIADNLATVVDATFTLPLAEVSALQAWVAIFCYALQLYFDFSGYSDMAIGLGRLLGFHFPENFDQPYRSTSIAELWRRWHMTLMRWLRDYVFKPLVNAGRRRGKRWTTASVWIVFLLCGVWHGAGFTFIVFGLFHGSLIVLEHFANRWFGWRPSGPFGFIWTFGLVLISMVFFRSPSLDVAMHYLEAMFGMGVAVSDVDAVMRYLTPDILLYMALGAFFSFAPLERLSRLRFERPAVMASQLGLSSASLAYSSLLLAANSFNPFIYFRF
jgi:alginate O-acetyltransferase complex protein AlgI